jgi:hypothetical protein
MTCRESSDPTPTITASIQPRHLEPLLNNLEDDTPIIV